jgi:hypothetical protein
MLLASLYLLMALSYYGETRETKCVEKPDYADIKDTSSYVVIFFTVLTFFNSCHMHATMTKIRKSKQARDDSQ